MQHPVFDLLGSALVPVLGTDIAAGTAGDVHLVLVAVAAVGADPDQLAVVFLQADLAVVAAALAVVGLGVQLGVHDVVVDELHDLQHGVDVLLHVGHFHIGNGAAGGELLELGLEGQLGEGVDLLGHMDMVGVGDIALVGDAVKAFGYEEPKNGKYEYTLCEVMDSHFKYKSVAPVIFVNVRGATIEERIAPDYADKQGDGYCIFGGIVKVVSWKENGSDDYVIEYDFQKQQTKFIGSGFVADEKRTPYANLADITFTNVTSTDIIGGVDASGNKTGLELVNECFPRFRFVPGIIIAPGFSGDSAVAAVIAAKAANINEHFSCVGIVDVPTNTVKQYSAVAEWKNTNNITDERLICCWPKLSLGGVQFNQSSQLAALLAEVDGENDDVPYVSPSNHSYAMDSAVLEDGTEVWLSPDTAAYLNSQGVVTALNFMDGWKCWGNRTAKYPGGTDVKDTFIPLRRMFSWIGNTLIQTFWQKVDAPLNRRQIDTIVDSANMWLNGLTAKEYILGGRVEFLETENPTTDLMDGKARFHVYITPPSPNREIDFVLEYDPAYVETLFA